MVRVLMGRESRARGRRDGRVNPNRQTLKKPEQQNRTSATTVYAKGTCSS